MISFACRQCGRRFDRPDTASGTLVFCVCGVGTTVPFESTLPPLAADETVPTLVPEPAPRFGGSYGRSPAYRDRTRCLNHPETALAATCAACDETFCGDCVLEIEGAMLCGPCKNFRIRTGQRPPGLSAAALCAPLVSLLTALPCLFVVLIGSGASTSAVNLVPWVAAALLPQLIALGLGVQGLRTVESNPRFGGHSLAISGLVSAVVVSVFVAGTGVMIAAAKP
jgi:hypothetical protein